MSEVSKGQINEISDDFLLDDIDDLPGFVVLPTGAYTVRLDKGIEEKTINDANYYDVQMTLVEVLDLDAKHLDEGEVAPKAGDLAGMLFARANEYGMGNFKLFVKDIAAKFDCKSVGQVREAAKGLEMAIVVKRVYDAKKERHNMKMIKAAVI